MQKKKGNAAHVHLLNPLTYLSPNKSILILILNIYWCSRDNEVVYSSICTHRFTFMFKTYYHLMHSFFKMSMFYFRERETKNSGNKKRGQKQCDTIVVIQRTPGSHIEPLSICKKPAAYLFKINTCLCFLRAHSWCNRLGSNTVIMCVLVCVCVRVCVFWFFGVFCVFWGGFAV